MSRAMSEGVEAFMGVTGASEQEAKRYLAKARGEVDAAVSLYFEEQENDGGSEVEEVDDEDEEEDHASAVSGGAGRPAARATPHAIGAVESILGKAIDTKNQEEESTKWGNGNRLGGGSLAPRGAAEAPPDGSAAGVVPKKIRTVHICFFADGFTVDDAPTKEEEDALTGGSRSKDNAAPAPVQRRTGMASLSDFKKPSRSGSSGSMPKLPKLPPLRSYDETGGAAFLAELKEGRVPQELRSRDEATGEPIGVSIIVQDARPEEYSKIAARIAEMQKRMDETTAKVATSGSSGSSGGIIGPPVFSGVGHSLSVSGPSGGGAAAGASSGSSGGATGGADPALIALVAAGPVPVADESKPTTIIQLRLASGSRVKAKLNLAHTVADLWRLVAAQMGEAAFAAASQHELSAGFPPKPLTSFEVTLADADLANASVTHRCR